MPSDSSAQSRGLRQHVECCARCGRTFAGHNRASVRKRLAKHACVTQTIRPRRGDLEAATQPHPFRPSGEYAGVGHRAEVCDLCGLAQRGTWVHPDD